MASEEVYYFYGLQGSIEFVEGSRCFAYLICLYVWTIPVRTKFTQYLKKNINIKLKKIKA